MTFFDWLRSWFAPPAPAPVPDPPPPPPTPQPQPQPQPTPTDPTIAALNAARAERGLAALAEDPRLTKAAGDWAATMWQYNRMSHSNLGSLMEQLNAPVAECVAEGQPDAASVVAAWLGDEGHRVIVLGDYSHVGVGHVGAFWCADFCREES